ncbi:hypothetical protein BS78_08G060400 [Paspalum vaginatum]|nr:hypothetical protein BS78_08G060400 [Paspalum vaginatum]
MDETYPFEKFRRWVPPPPNPPPTTDDEKEEASAMRIMNPPLCHCDQPSRLIRPNPGVNFTPFFRCPPRKWDGGQIYDFQEYVYGPKSHWPTDAEIEEFNSGTKKWPCIFFPPFSCKCGILARRGVVPSELGKGWYCGNSYGDFWEGRGCDWEYFSDQEEWFVEMRHPMLEPDRARRIEDRKNKIREDYGVLVPRRQDLKKLREDMCRDLGQPTGVFGFTNAQRLMYWRRHRSRYAPRVPEGQEDKEEREYWRMRMERDREEYRRQQGNARGKEVMQDDE